jgi:hypothetical protein
MLGSLVIRLISIPNDALPRRSNSISKAVRWYCWVETCSSLRIRPMTVEAVPRTARMIITRISQEGMDPNKFRTRIVASSRLGAAKVGNACVAIRWVTRWSESQYLVSIVFKDSPPLSCSASRACHNRGRFRIRPVEIKEDADPLWLFSGTSCVGYLLAWMPAFSASSRVTRTSANSSLRIAPP